MDRRSFLARIAAIPMAAAAVAKAVPELEHVLRQPYPSDEALAAIADDSIDAAQFAFDSISRELKSAYPPGCFEELMNRESVFLKHLRRGIQHDAHVFEFDLADPGGHS